MKKNLLVLLFICFILSCTKQQNATESFTDLTKEVISQKSTAGLRQSYSMLSSKEKESLWKTKLQAVLKNDAENLSKAQKGIVQQLLDLLITNGMEKLLANPQIGEALLDANLKDWEKHFDNAQLNLLIESPYYTNGFSILKAKEYLDNLSGPYVVEPPKNCTCRYNLGCGTLYCDWEATCTEVHNCGVFGGSACKGLCT